LSSYSNYEIRPNGVLDSHYANLHAHLDKVLAHLDGRNDEVKRARAALVRAKTDRTAPDGVARVLVPVEKGLEDELVESLKTNQGRNVAAVLERGLMGFIEDADTIIEEAGDAGTGEGE